MKKSLAFAAAITFVCAAAFCKELPKEASVDSYDDGSQSEVVEENSENDQNSKEKKVTKIKWNTRANREAAMEGDPYNQKKLKGNRNFGERLLNINKFTKIEPFSAYLKPTLGKLFVRKGHLIYREGTDIAGFMMYYDSSAYALQFAKAARAVVCNAIESYYKDFDEKLLDRNAKAKDTRAKYGFCEGYEDFGVASGMMTNYSRPTVFFGYVFVKKTPYFIINVRKAKNLAVNEKTEEGSLKANVIEQTYYLTKAQAKKLSVFLNEDNISRMQRETSMDTSAYDDDVYEDEYIPAEPVPEKAAEPVKEEAVKEEPAKAEPVKEEPAKTEAEKEEPAKTEPVAEENGKKPEAAE